MICIMFCKRHIFPEGTPNYDLGTRLSFLMAKGQEGDEDAYNELFDRVKALLSVYLKKRIYRPEEVDDVLQEALLSIHRARESYDPARPFLPWMYAIAQRRVVDYVRQQGRRSVHEGPHTALDPDDLAAAAPESDREQEREIEVALNDLNKKQRRIIRLIKFEGWSMKEVAEELGMGLSAVKVSAHRAYKRLGRKLEKQYSNA